MTTPNSTLYEGIYTGTFHPGTPDNWRHTMPSEFFDALSANKRILLTLPCNSTTHARGGHALLSAVFETLSDPNKSDIFPIGAWYNPNDRFGQTADLRHHTRVRLMAELTNEHLPFTKTEQLCAPEFNDAELIGAFLHQYLRPLIQTPDGQKRPIADIQRDFSRITLITHCFGSYVTALADQWVGAHMNRLGYATSDIFQTQKQLTQLCLTSLVPLNRNNFTTLHVLSADDEHVGSNHIYAENHLRNYIGHPNEHHLLRGFSMINANDHETLLVTRYLCRDNTGNYGDHDIHAYLNSHKQTSIQKTPVANALTHMLSSALHRATTRPVFHNPSDYMFQDWSEINTIKERGINLLRRHQRFLQSVNHMERSPSRHKISSFKPTADLLKPSLKPGAILVK